MCRFPLFRGIDSGGKVNRWIRILAILLLVPVILLRPAAAMEAAKEASSEASKDASIAASTYPSAEAASDGGASSEEKLLLEIQINGHSTGKIGEFTLRRGKLMARPDELRDLGFKVPLSRTSEADGLIPLSELPGVTWSLDLTNQVLQVKASNGALIPMRLLPEEREEAAGQRVIESGTGVTLNDDFVGNFTGGQYGGSGSFDLRGFAPWGTVNSDWLAYAGAAGGGPGQNTAIRLDSAYTFADINTLRRYSLGDFINGGLSWNRPVHFEGVQIRSDFSMRPDLVTFPLPTLTGSAAVPSTLDVLVNGNIVASHQVDPGPFEIPQLPVISGAGTITMTMTNAQGQQVSVTQPFYGGSTLLAPGLQTFSAQTGLVRRNWGSVSNDYGKMAGTAYYRRGLTQQFTVEATAEGTPKAYMAGAGGAALVGKLGVVNFDLAASSGSGQLGELLSVGAQHVGTRFSLGGSAILANRNYRDLASMNGSGIPRKQLSAFTGLSLKRFGSAGLAYAGADEDVSPTNVQVLGAQSEHSHIVTANYSMSFHHMSFYATEFKSLDAGGSNGLQAGFTVPLGRRRSASVSASSDGSGQVQVQQSAVRIGDWGYQGYVSEGNSNHEFGQVQYKSPVGLFTVGADYTGGTTSVRMESQGALSFVDRGIFFSNTIYDSFAIVDTSPLGHVRVYQENRDVGTTNKAGRLLVPDMRSFDLNHIGIEPTDIPPDATLNNDKRKIRPQDRSGVVVKFPIQFSHAALVKLIDAAGEPMPLGSAATLLATGAIVSVGYDGDAYIEGLSPHNELTVKRPNGRYCTVAFEYEPVPGDIPSIGPLRCREKRP
jgi:outer membrane usher protein